MVYRIVVDGKEMYAAADVRNNSLEADNMAREEIIRHYLDDEGAKEVFIDARIEEVDHE